MTPTTDAKPSPSTHSAADLAKRVFEFVQAQWRSVLFSAGIALILESRGVLQVLTKFSLLVVSSLAAQAPQAPHAMLPGMPAVVLLNQQDFIARYGERSPLDRCTLAADIQKVLDKAPARLAIDFDLSPLIAASSDERQCQRSLDELLDRHAATLVLLVPFPAATEPLLQLKQNWLLQRCDHGLHFADGTLQQSMGLVTEQLISDDAAGRARMAEQLRSGGSDHICSSARVNDARQNRWLNGMSESQDSVEVHEADEDHEPEMAPINFRALTQKVAVLELGSTAFAMLPSLNGNAVLLGGDWGRDDSYLTAIGTLPGVVIHAARLASLGDPVLSLPPIVSLWGDIVIALCFAWVIGKFWRGYVIARRLDLHFEHGGRSTALSMLVMGTFVLVYLSLVLFFFLAAEHMFSNWGVVIAPLLIAVSILLDGFVSGPVEQISQLLEAESPSAEAAPGTETEPLLLQLLLQQMRTVLRDTGVAWLVALAFVAASLLLPALSHGLAAWLFAGAQVALLLLLAGHLLAVALRGRHTRPSPAGHLSRKAHPIGHSRPWRRLARGGIALRLVRSLVFWSVLAWAGTLLVSHSLHL